MELLIGVFAALTENQVHQLAKLVVSAAAAAAAAVAGLLLVCCKHTY